MLSPVDRVWANKVATLSASLLQPHAESIDRGERSVTECLTMLAEAGLTRLRVPSRYGGRGATAVQTVLAFGELAAGCPATAVSLSATEMVAEFLANCPGEQAQKWLTILANSPDLAAFALTEPEAGSDISAIRTTATPERDGYRLNGEKRLIVNAGLAAYYLVVARVSGQGPRELTAFVIPRGAPGLEELPRIPMHGLGGVHLAGLRFNNCLVGSDHLVGERNAAWAMLQRCFLLSRLLAASIAVGVGHAALEVAVAYTGERIQFGKPLSKFQAVRMRLADAFVALEGAKSLILSAAQAMDTGLSEANVALAVAAAKLAASDAAVTSGEAAVLLHGGSGYITGTPERLLRAARAFQILEGVQDLHRILIGKYLTNARRRGKSIWTQYERW